MTVHTVSDNAQRTTTHGKSNQHNIDLRPLGGLVFAREGPMEDLIWLGSNGNSPTGTTSMQIDTTTIGGDNGDPWCRRALGEACRGLQTLRPAIVAKRHSARISETSDLRPDLIRLRLALRTMINELLPIRHWIMTERALRTLPPPLVGPVRGIDRIDKYGVHETTVDLGEFC